MLSGRHGWGLGDKKGTLDLGLVFLWTRRERISNWRRVMKPSLSLANASINNTNMSTLCTSATLFCLFFECWFFFEIK